MPLSLKTVFPNRVDILPFISLKTVFTCKSFFLNSDKKIPTSENTLFCFEKLLFPRVQTYFALHQAHKSSCNNIFSSIGNIFYTSGNKNFHSQNQFSQHWKHNYKKYKHIDFAVNTVFPSSGNIFFHQRKMFFLLVETQNFTCKTIFSSIRNIV